MTDDTDIFTAMNLCHICSYSQPCSTLVFPRAHQQQGESLTWCQRILTHKFGNGKTTSHWKVHKIQATLLCLHINVVFWYQCSFNIGFFALPPEFYQIPYISWHASCSAVSGELPMSTGSPEHFTPCLPSISPCPPSTTPSSESAADNESVSSCQDRELDSEEEDESCHSSDEMDEGDSSMSVYSCDPHFAPTRSNKMTFKICTLYSLNVTLNQVKLD